MLSEFERQILKLADHRFPYPEVFDITGCADLKRAEPFWRDMENRGYVEIHEFANCGAERIPGRFVSLTEATRSEVSNQKPEDD